MGLPFWCPSTTAQPAQDSQVRKVGLKMSNPHIMSSHFNPPDSSLYIQVPFNHVS